MSSSDATPDSEQSSECESDAGAETEAQLETGLAHHQAGRLVDAERIYRGVLEKVPNHPVALHLLAVLLNQGGQRELAAKLIQRSVEQDPDYAAAYYDLGNILRDLGRVEDAERAFCRAVELWPDWAEAQYNYGLILEARGRLDHAAAAYRSAVAVRQDYIKALLCLAAVSRKQGKVSEAVASYRQVLSFNPDHAEAHNYLGVVLIEQGKPDEAIASYQAALSSNPGYAEAYSNRGVALAELKRHEAALESYDQAIALKPDFAGAYNNRGNTLAELKRHEAALESYDQAIALKPEYAEAYGNRGNVLAGLQRYEAALDSYDQAIALKPDYAEAYSDRGNVLASLQRYEAALECHEQAIALKPDFAEAYTNRGNTLANLKRHEAALKSYDRAIALKPDYAEAYGNRGNVLVKLRRDEAALESLDRALQIKPDYEFLYGLWLHTRMRMCDWNDVADRCSDLVKKLERGERTSTPFVLLSIPGSPALQRQAAEIWGQTQNLIHNALPAIARHPAHDRIRIGYVSSDFREHPVSQLMVELFERHDRQQFEPIAISLHPEDSSQLGQRVRKAFARFLDVSLKSDVEIAQLMRSLEIDIAVDLVGLTDNARSGVFAHRAAPIQVNYLGYTGTTGADYMDYLVADRQIIPESDRPFYTEKIAYLPDTFMPRDSTCRPGKITATRIAAGLPQSGFVFCSFNNAYKLNPWFFDIWMRLLKKVPGSVLWLTEGSPVTRQNLVQEAKRRGIVADRLVFAPRTKLLEDHLVRLTLADLFLDTLPYNAHTTASDALWAGLPVLTCTGNTFAGRVAGSLLNAIGLPELIARTPEQYESLAIELATNPDRLSEIRQKLAGNRRTTPLFDTRSFTRHIEAAFTTMYDRYRAGLPPEHIYVQAQRAG